MRRLSLLFGLILFVLWLETGGFGAIATSTCAAGGLSQEMTNPHWACEGNSCVEVYACGVSDCSACTGCNPDEEAACLSNGGVWDSSTCTCEMLCSPSEESECINDWGTWDPSTCTCFNPCNAGAPMVVRTEYYSETSSCTGCNYGWITDGQIDYYEQRCEDGRLWDSWSTDVSSSYEGGTSDCWWMCS
jgi:hypothetical protein